MNRRKINFRGYSPELKKWVFGSFILMPQGGSWILDYQNGFEDRIRVDTNTVGQYTGLKDKTGKYIYENDILKYHGIVTWNDVEHKWSVMDLNWNEAREWHDIDYLNRSQCPFEIIGNIHDTPELLK